MVGRAAMALALFVLLVPGAHALDLFPGHEQMGAKEARILLRLPEGGTLHVRTEPPVAVALAQPGEAVRPQARAPQLVEVASLAPEESWHGLPGTAELVLRRDDPRQAVRILVEDETGAGAEWEWPAEPRRLLPGPGPAALLAGMALLGATLKPRQP